MKKLPIDVRSGNKIKTEDGQTHIVRAVTQPVDNSIVFVHTTCCGRFVFSYRNEIEVVAERGKRNYMSLVIDTVDPVTEVVGKYLPFLEESTPLVSMTADGPYLAFVVGPASQVLAVLREIWLKGHAETDLDELLETNLSIEIWSESGTDGSDN